MDNRRRKMEIVKLIELERLELIRRSGRLDKSNYKSGLDLIKISIENINEYVIEYGLL